MLTISKPLSAGQAQTYHQKEFTAKEQNYWSQRGVIVGEWQGRLAAAIRVSRRGFCRGFCESSARANTRKQATNWSASEPHTSITTPTGRP